MTKIGNNPYSCSHESFIGNTQDQSRFPSFIVYTRGLSKLTAAYLSPICLILTHCMDIRTDDGHNADGHTL